MRVLAVTVVLALLDVVAASSVTPIEKVVELLTGMLTTAESAKHQEVLQWTAYKRWCSDSELDKQNLVKHADLTIEFLQADIEKYNVEVQRLGEQVEGHQTDIVSFKSDLSSSIEESANASKAYNLMHQDYTESVHAIAAAVKVLKEQAYNRPQTMALLQHLRQRAGLVEEARHAVESFLSEASESADVAFVSASGAASREPGEAHAYEFQSGGVVEMLGELQDKFTGQLRDLEKEELKRRQAHELQVQDLNAQTAAAEHEIEKKSRHLAKSKQASVEASARLASISGTRADDAQFLEDLKGTCNQKSDDFQARQDLRAEEVEAIQKAIGILSSTAVAGAAKKHLPALAQHARRSASSFLQVVRDGGAPPSLKGRAAAAATFLQKEGARIGGSVLTMLAMRMREEPDAQPKPVFAKVRQMIQELIDRLEAEAVDEATHKQWCDKELGTNEQTRTDKSEEVSRLHLEIESLTSKVAILKREIAELSNAVATLTAQMAEALRLRNEEQDQNEQTIAEAAGAQMAVGNAMQILKDYYGKAAGSTVLAQQAQAPTPAIFNKPFKGQQRESDNIVAFLEVIQSDFARLETEVSDAERTAKSDFEKEQLDATADKEAKEGDISAKRIELTTQEAALQTESNNLDLEQADLDAALAYYEKLKPSCVMTSTESSFKERVQRREQEIASLKEGLEILNGQTLVAGPDSLYSSVDGGNRGWDIGITADTSASAALLQSGWAQ